MYEMKLSSPYRRNSLMFALWTQLKRSTLTRVFQTNWNESSWIGLITASLNHYLKRSSTHFRNFKMKRKTRSQRASPLLSFIFNRIELSQKKTNVSFVWPVQQLNNKWPVAFQSFINPLFIWIYESVSPLFLQRFIRQRSFQSSFTVRNRKTLKFTN